MKIKCRNINPETGEVCGALNPRSRKHCWKCGRELSSSNRPRIWLVLLITTLFVGGTIYLAIDSNKVEIIAKSSDPAKGTVTGGGNYVRFDTVTLIAQANKGCRFVEWNDGNTDSIRKVVADQGLIFVARFDSIVYITTIVNPDNLNTKDPVVPETPVVSKFKITVKSSNPDMGTVKGGGTYDSLAPATIEAIANDGYRFVSWTDGNKDKTRTVKVLCNQEYTARFQKIENKPNETYNLEWGNYAGPMKGGKPDGRPGKVTVTRTHDIVDASGNTITVYPGETITATKFDNGHLKSGEIHRKDGSHLLFMAD